MSTELKETSVIEKETAKPAEEETRDFSDMGYIDAVNAVFTETAGKIISLKLGDKEYPRVVLHRSFPHTYKNEFISVRDIDNKEIGMIRDMNELDEATKQLFERHLSIRYFAPLVTKIINVKDEFGYSFWDTETNLGNCRFVARRDSKNIILLENFEILIIDIDGNRFIIPDIRALSDKEIKMIELFL